MTATPPEAASEREAPLGRLARNSIWNLLGQIAPMAAALACIPALVRGLGVERFGILTLISVVIGYFGLFDLGLGRSLTKFVAERADREHERNVGALVWTALGVLLLLSVAGAVVVGFLAPWLSRSVLNVATSLQGETAASLRLLAIGFPTVFAGNGLRGVLEAHGRFGLINAVRAPMGVFNFVGPLLALRFSSGLVPVTTVLVAGRAVTCACFLVMCLAVMPALRSRPALDASLVGPLVRLGSWMTVSNVVGPFMVYLDRFVIGAVATASVVAYYTTPYELVSRMWVLPLALIGVLFPMFARTLAADRGRAAALFFSGIRYTALMLFPPILVVAALAREGLGVWLGQAFAQNSATVLQLLAVGVFFNSLAQVAFSFVQAAGRAELTARLHLVELPFYLAALWLMVGAYGVRGAAVAWTARVVLDAVAMFAFVWRLVPELHGRLVRLAQGSLACAAAFAAAASLGSTGIRAGFAAGTLVAFAVLGWRLVLTAEERAWVRRPRATGARWQAG